MLPRPCALLFASALLFWAPAHAQQFPADSTSGEMESDMRANEERDTGSGTLSAGFERNVNTYLWDLGGTYRLEENGWRIDADERFLRTLIRIDRNTIKDEQSFRLNTARRLTDGFAVTASFSSFIFSDNRALALNDLSTNKAVAGVEWDALPVLEIQPMAGVSFDNQQGILDRGFMYSGRARLHDLLLGRTAVQAELYSSAEYIDPRFQAEHRGSADFLATVGDNSINHTQLLVRQVRREFYLPFDSLFETRTGMENQIESREERIVTLSNTLQYRILRPLELHATVDLTQRDIARARQRHDPQSDNPFFDTDISEFHLNGNMRLQYDNSRGTQGMIRLELNERDENHTINPFEGASPVSIARQEMLEEQKNNSIQQTQLSFDISQSLGSRDTLSLSASTVKMQYDTPSDENYDDRDELWVLAGLRWIHRFSPRFQAGLSADLNMRHTVFIFAERSANNTWNRVLRLRPFTELRVGSGLVSHNAAEVVANYTVYDFETATLSQRSFSLRQLTISDSTTLHLGGEFWTEISLHLRFYERGELRWTAFTVRPVQFFDERTLSLSMLRIGRAVRASVGFRLFEQRRYGYEGREKVRSGLLRSYGPTGSLRLRFSPATDIIAEGWYQLTAENDGPRRTTPNLSLRVVWNL